MRLFPELPKKRYEIIYADPPWDYKGQTQHNGPGGKATGGALAHYKTVKLEQLKQLNVPSICSPDCLLFMWTSSPHLNQALQLMQAWGFAWATIGFIWHKDKTNPGFYTLSECEVCLIGKHGRIPRPRGSRKERQFLRERRRVHSMKPDEVRNRITRMFPTQKKIELFAVKRVEGWDSWGNQIAKVPK
jgi:N6-adenosine-specific RNA methylase IME4